MKTTLLTILTLLVSLLSYSQDWVWGLKASGNQQNGEAVDIAVDHQGNVVMAGYYQLKLKLGADSLYTEDYYYSDIFLCRMDSAHHIQWLKHIEAMDNYDSGIAVTVDDDKNIYLTGGIDYYVFVSKFDSLGNLLWNCDFNREIYGTGYDITTDKFDNVYVTGQTNGSAFVAKLDYEGKVAWTRIFDGLSSDGARGGDIAVDKSGSVYVAGSFDTFGFKIDSIPLEHLQRWGSQPFVTRLSNDGKVLWAISPQGITSARPQLALNSTGFYLASIVITETIDFGGITLNKIPVNDKVSPFIARYDPNGNILQAQISGNYYDGKGNPTDLATDLQDNIYLTRTGSGDYGEAVENFHIEKYNSSLELQWEKFDKTYGDAVALRLGIDPAGAVYIAGYSAKKDFILPNYLATFSSLGVAKLKTPSPIPLRPDRPKANRLKVYCQGEIPGDLTAQGVNVKWYSDPNLNNLIHEGNVYLPANNQTGTFYVTQTISGVESNPKEVITHISELNDASLTLRNDTLFASTGTYFHYQWFYEGKHLERWDGYGSNSGTSLDNLNYLAPHALGNYSVKITEGDCQKEIGIAFITKRIADNLQEDSYSLFPNPTRGPVSLVVKNDSIGSLKIRLIDSSGKVIDEGMASGPNNYIIASFDVSYLPSGIYLVQLNGNYFNRTLKLIKK